MLARVHREAVDCLKGEAAASVVVRVRLLRRLSLIAFFVAAPARADSYSWDLRSGRFEVHVFLSGFNEGAGEGGWSATRARELAAWGARFNAIVPSGARVTLARGIGDRDTTLTIQGARASVVTMPDGPDLDAALVLVARHFGASVPRPAPAALYTLQVFAGSRAGADAFASGLESRGAVAEGSFYDEACHPCLVHPARVLAPSRDRFWRVILGVYDRRAEAERARAKLAAVHHVVAWVAVL